GRDRPVALPERRHEPRRIEPLEVGEVLHLVEETQRAREAGHHGSLAPAAKHHSHHTLQRAPVPRSTSVFDTQPGRGAANATSRPAAIAAHADALARNDLRPVAVSTTKASPRLTETTTAAAPEKPAGMLVSPRPESASAATV